MKKVILTLAFSILLGVWALPGFASTGRFTNVLDKTTSGIDTLQPTYDGSEKGGTEAINDVIKAVIKNILLPLIIFVGIAQAMFGFYSIMTSTSDDAKKKGFNHIIWGVVGIIIIVSATFLVETLYGTPAGGGIFRDSGGFILSGPEIAHNLYTGIIYPFVKFLMYFLMAGLFLVAMIRAINLLFSNKEDGAKEAGNILKRNAFGVIVIIFSKALIEAVYGTEQQVLNKAGGLANIGGTVNRSLPFIFTIINYVMGFIGLFLLVMIIIQAVQILTKPTDEAMQKKLRKNIVYILIGLIVMGLAYVITNVFIVR